MRTLFASRNSRVISVSLACPHPYTTRVCNLRAHRKTSAIAPTVHNRHGLAGNMATAASILAVVRAAAPQIRCDKWGALVSLGEINAVHCCP